MHRGRIALVALLLTACADTPNRPTPSPVAPATATSRPLVAWFAKRGITLPSTLPAPDPAAKTAQDERLLGDGSGNGDVNWWDLWYLWHHLTGGYDDFSIDLDALDIDRDGDADWIDLGLLGDYLYGSGDNPHGIGQPMAVSVTASLSPHSDAESFVADGEDWKRFTVRVTGGGSVVVTVNGLTADTASLEISKRGSAPSRSFCPAERNDDVTVRDGDVIWIAGCSEGNSSIFIQAQDGTVLWSDVSVPVGRAYTTTTDTSFDIELVFIPGDFTSTQRSFIRRAADLWEGIITEGLEDTYIDFDSNDLDWWASYVAPFTLGRLEVTGTIDDVRIYVTKIRDNSVWGRAGPFWIRTENQMPILGVLALSDDLMTRPEHVIVEVTEHEIAHVLGFGTLWDNLDLIGNPSENDPEADTYFRGPLALLAFNAAGGWRYTGARVPVENYGDDGHWRESVFDREVMSTYAESWGQEALSDITIQSFADLGYQVDITLADPYSLPAASKPVAASVRRKPWCKVLRLPPGVHMQY